MLRTTVAVLASVTLATPLAAQAHPLEGTWNVSYPAGNRVGPDGAEPIMGTATLVFEAPGDSLVGTLTPEPVGGRPARPATRLAALRRDGQVTFVVTSVAKLNLNGAERDATSISTWILTATGDELSGTVERRLEGVDDLPIPATGPQPVKGTRAK